MLRRVARVFSLSIHADYRCRHSGNCCSADWDVPVELPIYRSLTEALASGRLAVSPAAGDISSPFLIDPSEPEDSAAVFDRTATGQCVFLDAGSNLCIVHRDLGAEALPLTCRVFPRVSIDDARGTHIALSHFCPTAASMLFRDDVPLAIVENPPAFPPMNYDGLVVGADDLPPLLTPHMLMDLDGYSAWEAHLVARCADVEQSPETALATMMRDARALGRWRPDGVSLREAIAGLPRDAVSAPPEPTLDASLGMHRGVMAAVPADLKPEEDEAGLPAAYRDYVLPQWQAWRAPLNRFIAAKSFATWTAYQGRGVATIVRGIEAAVALVRVEASRLCRDARRPLDRGLLLEAFRAADFALNHLAVGEDLAAGWSTVEQG
jgi:Fe-S-cluster containining protein